MEQAKNPSEIYQLRVVLRETSPHIWRRLLMHSNSTIAALHQTIQIAFGWSGCRSYQLTIQGQRQGVLPDRDARYILLSDVH